jgi:hypothetical protein
MPSFNAPTIPPEILALIQKPPLLKDESREEYNDLLTGLVTDIAPFDRIEWLWLIQFLDCSWEILRNRRYRAILIDLQRDQALRHIIVMTTASQRMSNTELEQAFARWTANPEHFGQHGIDPQSVPAMALIRAAHNVEVIDKILEKLQRRCDTILQQLEYRREVFASRARRAADKILTVEHIEIPRIESADAPLATEPPDQPAPNSSSSDEAPIVPGSSEPEAPSTEKTSTEVSTEPPSSGS